jgi:hypothetical protein
MSGKENTMELPITEADLLEYESGNLCIQDAFPQLNASQREFILTGITDEEWDNLFAEANAEEL